MKKDIDTRADIELLVTAFYDKVKQDETLAFIFTDIAKVKWEKHLPIMFDFFENMLFYTGTYKGNPMIAHKHLDGMFPLTAKHFERWNFLFNTTVNELFGGKRAGLVKKRA
jgi:hemoglobin